MLLRKGVYHYDKHYDIPYMDDWKKINEIASPEKGESCSNLNMEDITDYIHAKRVCKDFEIKSLGEYHDL